MIIEEFELFKKAYREYNLDYRENVSVQVLEYIRNRIIANKDFLEQLILATKENYTFDEILEAFDDTNKEQEVYKKQKTMRLNEFGFVSNTYVTSVGVIAIETNELLEIIKYFVQAIKSRNAVVISDIDFMEESLKSAILIIFSEALKKFKINSNLINIVPFEECYYELFDKVIFAQENEISENKIKTEDMFIYVEDSYFEEDVQKEIANLKEKGIFPKVIRNSLEDAVEKINVNRSFASCIYTREPKLAYKFINLVKTDNAFVNSSISAFSEKIEKHENPLYSNKKIMFELGSIKEKELEGENSSSPTTEKLENASVSNFQFENIEESKEELSLAKIETTPWYKRIFNKFIELKRKLLGQKNEE